jgi:hypothetical protein
VNTFKFKFYIGMMIAGAVPALLGFEDLRIRSIAHPIPHEITCEQLIREGPGDNAHIVLTDYVLRDSKFVSKGGNNGIDWTEATIAADPASPPASNTVGVVVITTTARSITAIRRLSGKNRLVGIVLNPIKQLSDERGKALADTYPGIDLGKVWVVQHEYPYPSLSWNQLLLLTYGGVLLSGLGVLLFIREILAGKRIVDAEIAAHTAAACENRKEQVGSPAPARH